MTVPALKCTDDELHLARPVSDHDLRLSRALSRWLEAHGVAPSTLVTERPVVRDAFSRTLHWSESGPEGEVVRRWRFAPGVAEGPWPAPFPDAVLRAAGHTVTETPRTRLTLVRSRARGARHGVPTSRLPHAI